MEEDQVRDNEPRGQGPNGEHVSREGVERLRALIGGARVAMLTTVEPGGALRSRPMAVQEVNDDAEAWLITQRTSSKVGEVEREQHVNLSFYRPARGRYVSVSGRATIVRDDQKIRALWHPTLQAWFPDGLDDPDLCLMRVCIDKAESWNAPVGNLVQVARLAGSIFGRTPRPSQEEGRDTVIIRTRQAGIGDTAGILGTAGGNMGVAPRAPKERGGARVAGSAGGSMGEAPLPGRGREAAPAGARATGTAPRAEKAAARETPARESMARESMGRETAAREPATRETGARGAKAPAAKPPAATTPPMDLRAPNGGKGAMPPTGKAPPPGAKAVLGGQEKPTRATAAAAKETPPPEARKTGDVTPTAAELPRKGGRGR